MAIDPSIPLGVHPIQVANPLQTLSTIAELQGVREQSEARRLAADKARQQAADEAAVRRVLTETNGDMTLALPRLRQIAPKAALEFETEISKGNKERQEALKSELDVKTKRMDIGQRVWQTVTDEPSLQLARPMLVALDPELDKILPTTYDAARVEAITNMGRTAQQLHEDRVKGFEQLTSGAAQTGLATLYGSARNAEEWQNVTHGAQAVGTPPALIASFGDYSPENLQRAQARRITPEKTAELEGQAATRAQTAAQQASQLAISQGQLDVARGHLAVSRAAEARQAATGAAGGKASEGERKAAGFHGQMQQALTTINQLESQLSDRDLYQIQSLPQEGITGAINRGAMSETAKRYIQAFNQFTEARLRPVSGAAIAASEYERDRATYGKQYGETSDLAAQRQSSRAQALEALRVMGGSAIQQTRPTAATTTPPPETAAKKFTVKAPNGKTYGFDTSAELAAFKRRTGIS
jgi:hypothetical protein